MRPSPTKSTSTPSLTRRNSAYVDVPLAPYHTPRKNLADPSMSSSKENTPSRPNRSGNLMRNDSDDIPVSRKRKLLDPSGKVSEQSMRTERDAKKPRLSVPSVLKSAGGQQDAHNNDPYADTEEPVFYCHQCNRKYAISDYIHCTMRRPRGQSDRCGAKYCRNCLRNRYGEDMDDIKRRSTSGVTKQERERHILQDGYCYACPRCRDVCNCRNCRKAKGLEPTGKFLHPVPQQKTSATTKDEGQTTTKATTKSSTAMSASRPKTKVTKKGVVTATSAGTKKVTTLSPATKGGAQMRKPRVPKAKPAAPSKPVPKPLWTRIETSLDQPAAEARIYIREFVQRFSSVLNISKTHLDELEEIAGTTGEHGARVGDDEEDEVEGWVSEPCVKAIILSLLVAIANSTDNEAIAKVAKGPIGDVRASGANLNKIWMALASLRDGLRKVPSSPFRYPDPLPPSSRVVYRTTRGIHQADTDLFVGNSAQLVPIVSALVESALHTKAIREELDHGVEHEKSLTRDVREETSRQKASWDELKAKGKEKGPSKAEREQHKQALQDIEHAHRVVSSDHILRYAPLGQDHEGRVYYLLTPSEAEREAALQLIAGKDSKVKINRRRGGLTEEDRRTMRRWSWFVAVWGKLPNGAAVDNDEDDEIEDAGDEERWWGFYEPGEIRKMAEWIAMKCELGDAKAKRRVRSGEGSGAAHGADGKTLEKTAFGSSPETSRAPSPMSDLPSDDEDDDTGRNSDEEDDISAYMRVSSQGKPIPTKRQLRGLVDGLQEYADLLQWRLRRIGGEPGSEAAENNAKNANSIIPAKRFYQ